MQDEEKKDETTEAAPAESTDESKDESESETAE